MSPIVEHFPRDDSFTEALLRQLNDQQSSSTFTDFTIHVGDTTIPCHKNILAANSEYFHTLLHADMKEAAENKVHLDSLQSNVVKLLIGYFYSGNIDIALDYVKDLVEACDLLLLAKVKKKCGVFINSQLCVENCLGWCAFATSYNMDNVMEEATTMMSNRFVDICQTTEFFDLTVSQLLDYIRNKDIILPSEDPVLDACFRWVEYDAENRKDDIEQIIENVQLPYCSSHLVQQLSQKKREPIFSLRQILPLCYSEATEQPVIGFSPRKCFGTFKLFIFEQENSGIVSSNLWNCDKPLSEFIEKSIEIEEPYRKFETYQDAVALTNVAICITPQGFIICGGKDGSNVVRTCHKFISKRCTWHPLPDMIRGRKNHRAVSVGENVYVIGGQDEDNEKPITVEMLDGKLLFWSNVAEIIHALSLPICVHLGIFIYVILNYTKANDELKKKHGVVVQEYNTVTDKWCMKASLPDEIISTFGASACSLNDSIFLVGGYRKLCMQYKQDQDTWTMLSQPCQVHCFGAVVCNEGKILLLGGAKNGQQTELSDSIEEYDPATDEWKVMEWKLPKPMRKHAAFILLTQK